MDGVISIPIAIWGFFGIPDLPHTTKAFYLNIDDREYGIERIEKLGREPPVKLSKKVLKGVFFRLEDMGKPSMSHLPAPN